MEQELLESLSLLFKNQPEQVSMALECKGKGGQPCLGPAHITVTVRPLILHQRYNLPNRVIAFIC